MRQFRGQRARVQVAVTAVVVTLACDSPIAGDELIFVDGRAVTSAGDSVLAITAPSLPGVLLRSKRGGGTDTLGVGPLTSPAHVQWSQGRWFVSDVREGKASVVVLGIDGVLERRIDVDSIATTPHQFAVLPDGRLVLESADGRLVTLGDDGLRTFAVFDDGPRPGYLVAALGGVIHAVPDRTITLYNERGSIRWRQEWGWHSGVFVTDIAVDSQDRAHILAGEEGREGFQVFGMSALSGEVVRWSERGPFATFVVRTLGEILPDSAGRWLDGG